MGDLIYLNIPELEYMARNSPVVLAQGVIYAEGIYQIIYNTAPHTIKHPYAYRDHFRIEHIQYPMTEGHVVYLIAERFQWRFIEYGWTEWRDEIKHRGLYVMTNALKAYAYGAAYGKGVSIK